MSSFLKSKFSLISEHRLFIKNTVMYFLAVGLNRGMPFLLIPLLTNVLNTEEYGIVSIAAVITGLLKNIIGLNPAVFIIVNFYKTKTEELAEYITNIFGLILATAAIFFSFYYFLGSKFSYFPDQTSTYLTVIFLTAVLMVIEALILTIIQMEKKGATFFLFSLISAGLQLAFVVLLVVIYRGSWKGKLFGDLFAELAICIILLIYLITKYPINWTFSWVKIKTLLAFSMPLLPHSISIWGMNFIDRFFIERIVGIQSVGVYSAAYNLGLGLMLIYDALQRAWQPFFFEALGKNDILDKQKIVRLTWIYYLFAIVLFGVITYAAYLVSPFMFGKEFASAFSFVPLIFLGYTFHGMYRVAAGYLYHLNKNGVLATITFSSAILNICLNYFLISKYGAIGAAQSTALTFLFTFITVKIIVLKTDSMPWFYFLKPVHLKNSQQGE